MRAVGLIGLLALVGGVLVLLRRPAHTSRPEDRNQTALEQAEREVRDLGSFTSPEDADDQVEDWGPGVPKEPR